MQRYGEGIYHTRPLEKNQSDNTDGWYFTSHKEKDTYYAFRSILEIPQSVIKLSEIKASIDTVVVDLATEKQLSFYEKNGEYHLLSSEITRPANGAIGLRITKNK